jgi:hypothetical protein
MNWKVKALIEMLEKNYKDDDTLFATIWDRAEVANAYDIEATENEWERIASGMGGGYSSDALYEEFAECVSEVLGHLCCEDCSNYVRDITETEDGETICASCIEGRKQQALAKAERTKALVKSDEDIVY